MSDVLLEEEILASDTPPADKQHTFRKSDLDENLFNGKAIYALCGFKKEGLAHPATNLPVCEKCHKIWLTFRDE